MKLFHIVPLLLILYSGSVKGECLKADDVNGEDCKWVDLSDEVLEPYCQENLGISAAEALEFEDNENDNEKSLTHEDYAMAAELCHSAMDYGDFSMEKMIEKMIEDFKSNPESVQGTIDSIKEHDPEILKEAAKLLNEGETFLDRVDIVAEALAQLFMNEFMGNPDNQQMFDDQEGEKFEEAMLEDDHDEL